ncbi:HlyD family secretion protein [Stella humosa]|uniref:Membrane fusion protein (MFP) family protein n=1 Tax=Stella humosa TaxID=94 RepID=A0A3N1MLZ6_9PROT|nr:HlyD family type I secretion periplasmic adaptor subunit [Stella humosa]ROQ02016.1 HlyD family secretion protein [Stella humosa]
MSRQLERPGNARLPTLRGREVVLPHVTRPRIGGPALIALAAVVLTFGGFGGWAAVAELDSAAVAQGTVKVESHRKTIQLLEPGIIKRILVSEGQTVQAGQVLIEMDETQARASHSIVQGQHRLAMARLARLQAELADADQMPVPAELARRADEPEIADILAGQRNLFTARREGYRGQVSILERKVAQLREEIQAMQSQERAVSQQIGFIAEETRGIEDLVQRGLERRPRLLALQRANADLVGQRGRLQSSAAAARQTISQTELQMVDLRNTRRNDIVAQVETTQKELGDLSERLVAMADLLRRMKVLSPHDGTVVDIKVFTQGGVIKAGEPILDIVPQADLLVVDARLSPTDIDAVRTGQRADIALVSYKRRVVPHVTGTVVNVSADLLTDQRSGEGYYTARIRVDAAELERLVGVELYPGMPVDAFILTGRRTALDYLLSPITEGLRRTFREE